VFAQTYTDWELYPCGRRFADESLAVARRIADPACSVISDGVNQAVCRLKPDCPLGYAAELLARMDSDDLMHPQRLARQVEFIASPSAS